MATLLSGYNSLGLPFYLPKTSPVLEAHQRQSQSSQLSREVSYLLHQPSQNYRNTTLDVHSLVLVTATKITQNHRMGQVGEDHSGSSGQTSLLK